MQGTIRWTLLLAVTGALALGTGCEDRRTSSNSGDGDEDPGTEGEGEGGPGPRECFDDADCLNALSPYCVGGRCEADRASEGEGEGEGSGEGEGEGDPPREGEGEGGPAPGTLCAECGRDEDCGGNGNQCISYLDTRSYCALTCAEEDDCQVGFFCMLQFDPPQCLPAANRCTNNCALEGCDGDDKICDPLGGLCTTPKGYCERCVGDDECEDGVCAQVGMGTYCLTTCVDDDGCPGGTTCAPAAEGRACRPPGDVCDRCVGVDCQEPRRPRCDPRDGECVACLEDEHCGDEEFYCEDGRCHELNAGCVDDAECAGNPAGFFCFGGHCVECVADEDCGPRARCAQQECIAAPCAGVECVPPGECNPETGRCDPSCLDDGCPENQLCDGETGQCYNADGSCDGASPCRPGSVCGGGGGLPGGGEAPKCTCPTPALPGTFICQGDEQCSPGFTCGDGALAFACNADCEEDDDCPNGYSCIAGFILGLACNSGPVSCHPDQRCSPFSSACEPWER